MTPPATMSFAIAQAHALVRDAMALSDVLLRLIEESGMESEAELEEWREMYNELWGRHFDVNEGFLREMLYEADQAVEARRVMRGVGERS